MVNTILRSFAVALFAASAVMVCNSQTQFNSTGQITAFKDIETNVQARVKCAIGGRQHRTYLIQFKNSGADQVTIEWQSSGLFTTPKTRTVIGPRLVTQFSQIKKTACGEIRSPDIFISAFIVPN